MSTIALIEYEIAEGQVRDFWQLRRNTAGGVKIMVQRGQSNPDKSEVGETISNKVKRTRAGVSSFSPLSPPG
jgi:hypothetical protein